MDYSEEEWRLQLEAERKGALGPAETSDSEVEELYRLVFTSLAEMPDEPFLPVEGAVMVQLARQLEKREFYQFWLGSAAVVVIVLALILAAASIMNASFTGWLYRQVTGHWGIVLFVGFAVGGIQFIDKRLERVVYS